MARTPFTVTFTVTAHIDPTEWQKQYGDVNPSAAVEGITQDLFAVYVGHPAGECGAVRILDVTAGLEMPTA